tara:strand:+ start:8237 stop:10615 length:2379 start_codon:yes stop_codon:yes gene_type:complete
MNLRKVFFSLIGLLLLVAILLKLWVNTNTPLYQGQLELNGLDQETEVYFDDYGIPHIYAENNSDLFKTLGYVHAQERLWQMELLRRVASGRLSELFGAEFIDNDKFFLNLGIAENSFETVNKLEGDTEFVQYANAYLDGINQFIHTAYTPIEYKILGLDKEEFDLVDVYNILGYMSFSFAMAQKTDPMLSKIKAEYGEVYLDDLAIDMPYQNTLIPSFKAMNYDQVLSWNTVLDRLNEKKIPSFVGSNSWVLSADKSESGGVLFANDPHIAFAQPAVWYEAHLNSPQLEKYGFFLAGVPFPLIGQNRTIAHGLTMFENDDIDFYQEDEISQEYYRDHKGDTLAYSKKSYNIQIKDGEDVSFTHRSSFRGPVLEAKNLIHGIQTNSTSISWQYLKGPNRLLEGLFDYSFASSFSEFESSLDKIHAPGLNVMYGDVEGNIAWWTVGRLYQLNSSVSTKFMLNGQDSLHQIKSYHPFEKNPSAINPPWNYVYSANNQVDSAGLGYYYPGYYLPEDRAKRIVTILEDNQKMNLETMQEMILDNKSTSAPDVISLLAEVLDVQKLSEVQKEKLKRLKDWTGTHSPKDENPSLYHKWLSHLLLLIFEDEIGEEPFKVFKNTHVFKRSIPKVLSNSNAVWWDNIHTLETEKASELVTNSFLMAFDELSDFYKGTEGWYWSKLHVLEHKHAFSANSFLRSCFNVGPFEVAGSKEVINNLQFDYVTNSYFDVNIGPSTRRILDMSKIEDGLSVLPTGQSGNVFSVHYSDQAQLYNQGKFRKMLMNHEVIKGSGYRKLLLKP